MATIEQLSQAFIKADDAGDVESARMFADEIRRLMAAPQPAQPQEPVNVAADVAKSAGTGVVTGAAGLAGLPGMMEQGADWLARQTVGRAVNAYRSGGQDWSADQSPRPRPFTMPSQQDILGKIEGMTGPLYQPQTTAGQYAKTIGEFAPAALAPGSAIQRTANVLLPGAVSETAGQATKGTAAEPYARFAGGIAGAMLPAVAQRAITPLPVNAERARNIQVLRDEGVDVTAGQATGRKRLAYRESEMGGARAADVAERQAEQFTAATLRRVGENATRATPEVIDRAFTRIGRQFDELGSRNALEVDRTFANRIANAQSDYSLLANPMQRQILTEAVDDIIAQVQRHNGTLPGAVYKTMRERLGGAARSATYQDNQLAQAYRGIVDALDGAMERSIRRNNPSDLGAWRQTRQQYNNMLTIERAVTSAGAAAREGLISPTALRAAVTGRGKTSRREFARGRGDFADLARAGENVMKPLPDSGTAGRLRSQGVTAAVSGGLGAALGGQVPELGPAFGAMAGVMAPAMFGRLAMTRPAQAWLMNQAAPGPTNVMRNMALQVPLGLPRLSP